MLFRSRALPDSYILINLCILVNYTRKHLKIAVSMSSKKVFWVRFGFSNFFRLPETTEFFCFLGLFQKLTSELTYVFWLITQENTRKLQYECPQKKIFCPFRVLEFFSTVRNDRIFLFSRTLPETCFGINLCILVNYTRNHSRTAVSMSSKIGRASCRERV